MLHILTVMPDNKICRDLLAAVPDDVNPPKKNGKGALAPLTIFLGQELAAMEQVWSYIHATNNP